MCDVYTFHTLVVAKILNFSHRVSASPPKKGGVCKSPRFWVDLLGSRCISTTSQPQHHGGPAKLPTCRCCWCFFLFYCHDTVSLHVMFIHVCCCFSSSLLICAAVSVLLLSTLCLMVHTVAVTGTSTPAWSSSSWRRVATGGSDPRVWTLVALASQAPFGPKIRFGFNGLATSCKLFTGKMCT